MTTARHQKRLFSSAAQVSGQSDGHTLEAGRQDCAVRAHRGDEDGTRGGSPEQGARAEAGEYVTENMCVCVCVCVHVCACVCVSVCMCMHLQMYKCV